jgi:hypothetical protein
MPHGPRLDIPGALHHVMVRGESIEARGVVSYVAVRIGRLRPTKFGKLLRVFRQSV